ncbi:MAG: bacteriorhodopsin-like [Bacteroidota bacterium]
MFHPTMLLDANLAAGDVIGFTFFIGYMAMFAATVFFFFERQNVQGKWKTSLLVSGLITMIAAVHYYYMRDVYLASGESPTQFRYIDWTLTVPLMCVEFYLILRAAGAPISLMWKMIAYSVLMLVTGYIGEAIDPANTILWGVVSTLGWAGIVYEIFFGSAKNLAANNASPAVQKGFKALRLFVLIGWAIYPIGYMTMEGNLLAGTALNMDLLYNIGDAVNKIGFGLVCYSIAVGASKQEAAVAA